MQKFIVEQNVKNFRDLLLRERSEERRRVLTEMIAEEEAKLTGDTGRRELTR